MEIVNHIELRDGTAFIVGRNVKAEMVARMVVGTDYSIEDVMEQYDISAADVHAAIAYYYDNQAALDSHHAEVLAWLEANALTLDKLRAKIATRQNRNG